MGKSQIELEKELERLKKENEELLANYNLLRAWRKAYLGPRVETFKSWWKSSYMTKEWIEKPLLWFTQNAAKAWAKAAWERQENKIIACDSKITELERELENKDKVIVNLWAESKGRLMSLKSISTLFDKLNASSKILIDNYAEEVDDLEDEEWVEEFKEVVTELEKIIKESL